MTLYPKLILDALATVRYPGTGKNLVEAEMVADNLRIDGMSVSFSLIFEKPTDPFMKSMLKAAETAIMYLLMFRLLSLRRAVRRHVLSRARCFLW